jgi:hypothetical protein
MKTVSPVYCVAGFLAFLMTSCDSLKQSSKYHLNEGYYKSKLYHKKLKRIYLVPGDDSIKVYTAKRLKNNFIDTTASLKIAFPANHKPADFDNYIFRKNTFDIDVLSILFKYRPSTREIPNQFTTSIYNGAIYLGYRTDIYHLKYKESPLHLFKRNITHYGFSVGMFSGIGASRIDENVTDPQINVQYDGFINLSGVAVILAVNKLSCGLTMGFDHLLDKYRHSWIYQGKPWIGIALGLNLN